MLLLRSYRNQSIDLLCKSIDWFLFEGNTGILWVNQEISIREAQCPLKKDYLKKYPGGSCFLKSLTHSSPMHSFSSHWGRELGTNGFMYVSKITATVNVFKISEKYQTPKKERFVKIVNGFLQLTIFAKRFILDVWKGSKYTSRNVIHSIADIPYYPWKRTQNLHATYP